MPEGSYWVTIMGDSYCGKSSIMKRYVRNEFTTTYTQTLGADYCKKDACLDGCKFKLTIFDTDGDQDVTSQIDIIQKSDGIILVFDFVNKSTLEHIDDWLRLIKLKCRKHAPVVLLGNKIDLPDKYIQVTTEDVTQVFLDHYIDFIKGSAKQGYNIDEAFRILVQKVKEAEYVNNMISNGGLDLSTDMSVVPNKIV